MMMSLAEISLKLLMLAEPLMLSFACELILPEFSKRDVRLRVRSDFEMIWAVLSLVSEVVVISRLEFEMM